MLTSRKVLDSIGLLDESYDFYYEDIEWCHRVWCGEGAVAYIAEAEITHLGDQSLSRAKVWAAKSEYRSALRYFREYRALGKTKTWFLWTSTVVSFHLRAFAFAFLGEPLGKPGHAEAYRELSKWILDQRPKRVEQRAPDAA
jgi:GT2 family glycosyltransferase